MLSINYLVSTKIAHSKSTQICKDNEHDNVDGNDWHVYKKYTTLSKNLISIPL